MDNVYQIDPGKIAKLKALQQRQQKKSLDFLLNENGGIKNRSAHNVVVILENDPLLKGLFKFNEYTLNVDVVKKSTDHRFLNIKEGEYKDDYTIQLAGYIEDSKRYNHVVFDNSFIEKGVYLVAIHHSYNPVQDYFNDAYDNWDGQARIYKFLPDFLGADQTPLTTKITQKMLVAAVAKAYNPETKVDLVLDLVGGQGIGKTTLLQKLAPLGYYTDQFTTFADKDSFEAMRNAIIVNDDEMTATNNSTFEELKKFVSMQEFGYRKAYGHEQERFPKKFILCRTTNDRYYLKDKTGERRFLPIMAHPDKQVHSPVTDLTPEYIKQLWGEAVHIYRDDKDFSLAFTKDEDHELKLYRQSFLYTDDLEDRVTELMDNEFKNQQFISNFELEAALGVSLVTNRKLSAKVQNVMVNTFNYKKSRGKKVVRDTNGKKIKKTVRGYRVNGEQ